MFTQLKAAIAGGIVLVVLIIAGLIYWRGSSNATKTADLKVARQTIKVDRETLKITSQIDMRVNAEGIQTATTAQEATREIDAIRTRAPAAPDPAGAGDPLDSVRRDADAARVLQLAREARAEAVRSAARLQSAGTGAR